MDTKRYCSGFCIELQPFIANIQHANTRVRVPFVGEVKTTGPGPDAGRRGGRRGGEILAFLAVSEHVSAKCQ